MVKLEERQQKRERESEKEMEVDNYGLICRSLPLLVGVAVSFFGLGSEIVPVYLLSEITIRFVGEKHGSVCLWVLSIIGS